MLPGDAHHEKSSDRLVTNDSENMPEVVSVAYLNTVNVPGTPPHDLQLKIGALVMFIRNINFDNGLVNGKREWFEVFLRKWLMSKLSLKDFLLLKYPESVSKLK